MYPLMHGCQLNIPTTAAPGMPPKGPRNPASSTLILSGVDIYARTMFLSHPQDAKVHSEVDIWPTNEITLPSLFHVHFGFDNTMEHTWYRDMDPIGPFITASLPALKTLGIEVPLHKKRRKHVLAFLQSNAYHVEDLRLDVAHTNRSGSGHHLAMWKESDQPAEEDYGFGLVPVKWATVDLAGCCPALRSITLCLTVPSESDTTRYPGFKAPIYQWRYALRLLASGPPTLRSIKIGLFNHDPVAAYQSPNTWTLGQVDWTMWDAILRRFEELDEIVLFAVGDKPDSLFNITCTQARVEVDKAIPLSKNASQNLIGFVGSRFSQRVRALLRYM
ncbi:hypothetical protein BXZ70DRAFT_939454 [Cristinia sonorae]|uniref:Uncharacterized protein n=1 Tax=Cristinia sonorae TaxID=1940300 RepID=A0A8K0XQA5_9AGAR|nr:hypothetical protein BXZ70DRAFT_939454 [Cristinia sonorae]